MRLVTGTRIGQYEIVALIGVGGMGEVYRAQDSRLGRQVALKILPHDASSDTVRRERLEREARTLAALNHPHIAQLYGFEESTDIRALVMELVEGPTLAERLAQSGRFAVDEAVAIARQIADALEAAHEQGIVHRDLKPSNVKIREDGTVKVLDFGLAMALEASAATAAEAMNSPTRTVHNSGAGIIVGTAAYMAPEQARGKPVDRRADVWAFGVVLYEMITGRRAFEGDEISDTFASVLKQDPDWTALPAGLPTPIRRVLRRCLEKDPHQRISAIADARLELNERDEIPTELTTPKQSARRASVAVAAAVLASLIAAIAIIGLAVTWRRPPTAPVARFSVPAPAGTTLFPDSTGAAISPDGRLLALVTGDVGPTLAPTFTGLWLRALDSLDARPLPGTDGATFPFWSPDGRQLAFFSNHKLKKITLANGHIDEICDAPDGRGGTWSTASVIVFSPVNQGPLMRVSAAGGKPEPVTSLDATAGEHGHRFPSFFPDADHFVYLAVPPRNGEFNIFIGSLSGRDRKLLLSGQGAPVVAGSGHLLLMRRGSLIAQPFDPKRLALSGEPVSLPDVPRDVGSYALGGAAISASPSGIMTYVTHPPSNRKLVWLDQSGRLEAEVPMPPGTYIDVGLAPNRTRAAVVRQVSPGDTELWIVDLVRGGLSRLVNAPGQNGRPVFSPDSERVSFSSDRDGPRDMYLISAQGAAPEQPIYRSKSLAKDPLFWSSNGRFLVFRDAGLTTSWDLWTLPLSGGSATPYVQGPGTEVNGAISPDGQWMAYESDETGRFEVYVQEFPVPRRKYRVTSGGGARAWWRADSRQLLILNADWTLALLADVRRGADFSTDAPRRVGPLPKGIVAIDVTADLKRLLALVNDGSDGSRSVTVVQNWVDGLEKR